MSDTQKLALAIFELAEAMSAEPASHINHAAVVAPHLDGILPEVYTDNFGHRFQIEKTDSGYRRLLVPATPSTGDGK